MQDSELNRDRLRQIVEDPHFAEAIRRAKDDMVANWRATTDSEEDDRLRQRYWHLDQALDIVVNKLTNMAHSG